VSEFYELLTITLTTRETSSPYSQHGQKKLPISHLTSSHLPLVLLIIEGKVPVVQFQGDVDPLLFSFMLEEGNPIEQRIGRPQQQLPKERPPTRELVIEIDTLVYHQTEKIETEVKDVDRIRITKVYALPTRREITTVRGQSYVSCLPKY
jgi:hypothetical protein